MNAGGRLRIYGAMSSASGDSSVWTGRFPDSPEFERLIQGKAGVNLGRVALEIAADAYPGLNVDLYLKRIDELTGRTRARCGAKAKPHDIVQQINWTMFVEEGMKGNREHYFDPRNSYLHEVLDRKLGVPVSLSILYLALAERLGLRLEPVHFPSHLMLRVDEGTQSWFVDPYESGAVMDQDKCEKKRSMLAIESLSSRDPMTTRMTMAEVVTRLLRGLKATYWNGHDVDSAILVQQRLAALNRNDPYELRDLGVMYVQADRLGDAIDPLETYLAANPSAEEVRKFSALLTAVRRQVIQMN